MSVTATNPVTRMSLEELATHPEWEMLSDRQRMFCIAYITSGLETGFYDAETAVKMSYDVKSYGASAKVLGYQLLGHKKVRAIMALHFGRGPQSEMDLLLPDLARAIRRSLKGGKITVATQRAIEFYEAHAGKLEGVGVAAVEPAPVKLDCGTFTEPEPKPTKWEINRREKDARREEAERKERLRQSRQENEFGFGF